MSENLPDVLRTHAESMNSEGWYTVANVLDRAASEIEELRPWKARELETQEALQKIGEEFGVHGGEPRVDGIRRVLTELTTRLALAQKDTQP